MERRQRLPELLAQAHVGDGQLQGAVQHPSGVQADSVSGSAASPAPSVSSALNCSSVTNAGPTARLADRAADAVQSDSRPMVFEAAQCGRGPHVGDHHQTVGLETDRSRQPFGHRVRQGPVSRAAAQRGRRLEPVGVGPRIQVERTQTVEHRFDQRGTILRLRLCLLNSSSPPAALESPERLAALFGVIAQIEDHLAPPRASGTTGSAASRCCRRTPSTPGVPPVVLDLTEEPGGPRVVVGHLGRDIGQHLGAVLVQFRHGDPVGGGIAGRTCPVLCISTTR